MKFKHFLTCLNSASQCFTELGKVFLLLLSEVTQLPWSESESSSESDIYYSSNVLGLVRFFFFLILEEIVTFIQQGKKK